MKTRLFTFAALALALAACTNDNENLNDGPNFRCRSHPRQRNRLGGT